MESLVFDLEQMTRDSAGNVGKKLSIIKHRKKQATNDAQLLMNRIALLQKEEDRARKKIDITKERAKDIIILKSENETRIKAYINAVSEEERLKLELKMRNKEQDSEGRRARNMNAEIILNKKREDVANLQKEKKTLTKIMIQEQEMDLRLKQKRREDVKKMEEDAKRRREQQFIENERKVKEYYEQKALAEEIEAARAEKMVRILEKKEREWIAKLQEAQDIQKISYIKLEKAVTSNEIETDDGQVVAASEYLKAMSAGRTSNVSKSPDQLPAILKPGSSRSSSAGKKREKKLGDSNGSNSSGDGKKSNINNNNSVSFSNDSLNNSNGF
jgi:hypothetical protein